MLKEILIGYNNNRGMQELCKVEDVITVDLVAANCTIAIDILTDEIMISRYRKVAGNPTRNWKEIARINISRRIHD